MFGTYFYHAMTRRFIAVFGTLFNDIHIQRTRDDATTQDIKVPLTYGSYEKTLARLNQDPALDRQVAGISPALSFVIGAPRYDSKRKLQSTLQRCIKTPDGTKTQYLAVPYNFNVSLFIYAKEEEDGLQILEQILPYFTPSLTVTVIMDDELGYKVDVPVILNTVDYENSKNWGSFEQRRYLIWELKFTMKGEYGGPISASAKPLIKFVRVPIHAPITGDIEEVDVQPGLTANGEPTTKIANTIPYTQINSDDNYDYIVQIISGFTANT